MLTKKEIVVLNLRKKGLKQDEIAKKLKISQPAVSFFESNIRRKVKDSLQVLYLLKEMKVRYNKGEEILEFKEKVRKRK